MKHLQFLTTRELLYRKFIESISAFSRSNPAPTPIQVKGYTLLKDLSDLSSGKSVFIGKFKNIKTGTIAFVKKYAFKNKGVRYASLINELAIMHVFTRYKLNTIIKHNLIIPRVIAVGFTDKEMTIVSEYKPGKMLKDKSETIKVKTLIHILDSLIEINQKIKPVIGTLPVRKTSLLAVTFGYFLLRAVAKQPQQLKQLIKLSSVFYANYFESLHNTQIYGLVHRDLHSKNILINKGEIIITDWEGAVVTDSLYDVAMMGRLYWHELSLKSLLLIYSRYITTETEARRFIYLTIYHIVQTMAVDTTDDVYYYNTEKYSKALFKTIIPSLLTKGTNLAKTL